MALSKEQIDGLFSDESSESLLTDIITWEEEGQTVVGKVLSVEPFTDGEFDTPVNKYLLKTEYGTQSCVLGAAADKGLGEEKALKGRVIAIRYGGKKQLKDGKHVNVFRIIDVSKKVKL